MADFKDLMALPWVNNEPLSNGDNNEGVLYLCATPIGNLEDITIRVLTTLNKVDLIAAEDTRHSIKLQNHYNIKTPMISYHEHNKVEKAKELVLRLKKGQNIAVITDAGTPGISDPGEELVRQCIEAGIRVTSLPGATAFVTALTMSGQPTRRFRFEAFLPVDKKERTRILESFKEETATIILYEAPHHLLKTLRLLATVFPDNRSMSICRELTKKYEEIIYKPLSEMIVYYELNEPRGEFVIVIKGRDFKEIEAERISEWEEWTVKEHVEYYISSGMDKKEAMKSAARDRGLSKRDIYNQLLN